MMCVKMNLHHIDEEIKQRKATRRSSYQVGLLLTQANLLDLGVGEGADDSAVFELLDLILAEARLGGALGGVLGEGTANLLAILLDLGGAVPVLVEAALDRLVEVISPDGAEGLQATGSGLVADQTDNNHGRGFDDCDSLQGLLLVQLGAGTVDITQDVSHTSLTAEIQMIVVSVGRTL